MRRTWFSLVVILACAATAQAQMGKKVAVPMGTPEDKALNEIYAASDPAQKIALLDKLMADYGKGDLELLCDQLYVNTYQTMKNDDKVIEYGQKVLELDPTDFSTVVTLARAEQDKKDTDKLFTYGEQAAAILARFKAAPAPHEMPEADWEQQKAAALKEAETDLAYLEYAMYSAAFETAQPAAKAALFERFVAGFPASQYAENALEGAASAYQQAQNFPKMIEVAQKVLAVNPNNVDMLLLLSDSWSEQQKELDKSEAYAKKALQLLATATKPEALTPEQWQQRVNLQKGMAESVLGQVYVIRSRNPAAIEAFKVANPLLKSNDILYGRNLYRLGFTLAKMQRMEEAKSVLNEAVKVNSPYRALAQQTLDKINGRSR